jgi:hypothetical protein
MKILKIGLFAIILVLLNATFSSACTCMYPTIRAGFSRATAVFSGRVITASPSDYTFEVERVWKGVSTNQIKLYDSLSWSTCAAHLKLGERYLIFATTLHSRDSANPDNSTLYIDTCNNHRFWKDAKKITKVIGKGKQLWNLISLSAKHNNSFNRSGMGLPLIENLDAIRQYFPTG